MEATIRLFCIALLLMLSGAPEARADASLGAAAFQRGDYATALSRLTPLAENGDADAQFLLGEMHFHGHGVPPNPPTAADWYRRAARGGHAEAQATLGGMYLAGIGVPRHYVAGYYWTILAVVWRPGGVRDAAFNSLAQVAKQLDAPQLGEAARRAAQSWRN